MTHICVSDIIFIGSDYGLSPCRRQAIIWTNAGILLMGPLGTNLSEILIEILTFSFKKMRLNVLSAKRRPFCLGLKNSKPQQNTTHCQQCVSFFGLYSICYTKMLINIPDHCDFPGTKLNISWEYCTGTLIHISCGIWLHNIDKSLLLPSYFLCYNRK